MNAYAHTLLALEKIERYQREAEQSTLVPARPPRIEQFARSRGVRGVALTARELRRIILRRLLGEAATA